MHPFRLYLLTAAIFFLTSALVPHEGLFIESLASGAASVDIAPGAGRDQAVANAVRWWPTVVMLVMVPVTAGVLKVTLGPSRGRFIEHMVFSLHLHAVLFVLLTISLLARAALQSLSLGSVVELAAVGPLLLGLLYLTTSVRRVYAPSWLRTAGTVVAASGTYLAITVAAVLAIVGFSVR